LAVATVASATIVGSGAGASAAYLPVAATAASQPVIRTEIGGPGSGPARNLSVDAFDVALDGYALLVVDNGHDVLRSIDVRTGRATVLAGTGVTGTTGDGGPARRAALDTPTGVAYSPSGTVYVADGNRIRAVSSDGQIRTVVGSTIAGFSGDGGPASAARLHSVFGLALDRAGNLYIADGDNHRIRVVDAATQHIRTIAGSGNETASGDGGPATKAGMSPLNLLVTTSGDVVFTDFLNNRVRRISHGVVSTIAGTGNFGFSGDGGPATAADLATPHGLASGPQGSLYVTDNGNSRIRQITADGKIHTVAGSGAFGHTGDGGPATQAALADPFGITTDTSGALYISETDGVRRVAPNGTIGTLAGNGTDAYGGDGGPAGAAQLSDPQDVVANGAGDLFIADDLNCRIRKIDHQTKLASTVAGTGVCGFTGDGGPATLAQLNRPRAVAVDRAGNLFIADTNNLRVREVSAATGRISTVAGTGALGPAGDGGKATGAALDFPYGIAVDGSGNLAISQYRSHTVRVVNGRTHVIRTAAGTGQQSPLGDGGPATKAGLSWPRAVAYGPAGDLYIADTGHLRVRRVDARTGRITTVVGNGTSGFSGDNGPATAASVASLTGLAIGPDASIYLSDSSNHRVRRVRAGVIRTIAGDGSAAFAGDGGVAVEAGILDPQGLVLDPSGALHVCDARSGRVRIIRGLH
jgi:hypothetical protein